MTTNDPTPTPAGRNEDDVLERIGEILGATTPGPGEIHRGDDAAVLGPWSGQILVSTDTVVAGVHCDLSLFSLEDFGWKAVTSAVSDIAAMGGVARSVVIAVSAPAGTDHESLTRGFAAAASACGVDVIGGDLTSSSQLVVTVTVFGECPSGEAVTRRGAQSGDAVFITGPLGASAAGLRLAREGSSAFPALRAAHARPVPRLREGLLARDRGVHAMMDLSDGLSLDAYRLAVASGCVIELDHVPVSEGATGEDALHGGEDYELLFTTSEPEFIVKEFVSAGLRAPIQIGTIRSGTPTVTLHGEKVAPSGWQHRL